MYRLEFHTDGHAQGAALEEGALASVIKTASDFLLIQQADFVEIFDLHDGDRLVWKARRAL